MTVWTVEPARVANPAVAVMATLSSVAIGTFVLVPVAVRPALAAAQAGGGPPGLLFVPAAAALAFVLAALAMRIWPEAGRADGWLVTAAGALVVAAIYASGVQVFVTHLLLAMGAGAALAGLFHYLNAVTQPERVAVAAGLVAGLLLGARLWSLLPEPIRDLRLVIIPSLVLATAVLALIDQDRREREEIADWWRLPAAVAAAAVVALATLALRRDSAESFLDGEAVARPDAVTTELGAALAAVVIGLVLGWAAMRHRGVRPLGGVVLGIGLAAPLFLLVTEAGPVRPDQVVVTIFGAAAGAGLSYYAGRVLALEAVGLLIAALGVYLRMVGLGGELSGRQTSAAVMAFGCALSLGAALVTVTSRPRAYLGAGLGVAALLLTSQVMGELVFRGAFSRHFGTPWVTPLFVTVAGMLLLGLILFYRNGSDGIEAAAEQEGDDTGEEWAAEPVDEPVESPGDSASR